MKIRRLPRTDSIKKLARFWDSHDLSDYEGALGEVSGPVFVPRAVISINLESAEAKAVRKMARSKGVPDAELIRGWVREKIRAT